MVICDFKVFYLQVQYCIGKIPLSAKGITGEITYNHTIDICSASCFRKYLESKSQFAFIFKTHQPTSQSFSCIEQEVGQPLSKRKVWYSIQILVIISKTLQLRSSLFFFGPQRACREASSFQSVQLNLSNERHCPLLSHRRRFKH